MSTKTNRPKMAPDKELKALFASGLKLWASESLDGPLPENAVTDSAGYKWIPKVTRTPNVKVQCVACLDEFETHPANVGFWNIYCDECENSQELAAEYERA